MPLSKPLLPTHFLQKVQSDSIMSGFPSRVFEQDAHRDRLAMRNWETPISPDSLLIDKDPAMGYTIEAQRTTLHLAAFQGDVLAVAELLQLGATADKADTAGVTPLSLAISQMVSLKSAVAVYSSNGTRVSSADKDNGIARLAWVARILIEQHADVNRTVNGVPLLHLSCMCKSWDTISLLLKHGAKSSPTASTYFSSRAEKSRFTALANSTNSGHPRPARVCPCWSGKVIADCHAKEQPYPLEFMCVCGSGKSYRRCCHSRKAFVVEKWDKTSARILHYFDHVSKLPEFMRKQMSDIMAFDEQFEEAKELLGVESKPIDIKEFQANIGAELLSKGLIDPAFAYPMGRVNFVPKPQGRSGSRVICERSQERWNALVDEYILHGNDDRSKADIERVAKIGKWNGALIRVCEGVGCGKVERRDVANLKLCSQCKISVYCGTGCQRSAWKNHKAECGSPDQHEQALPSQEAVQKHLVQSQRDILAANNTTQKHAMLSYILSVLKEGSSASATSDV